MGYYYHQFLFRIYCTPIVGDWFTKEVLSEMEGRKVREYRVFGETVFAELLD